MCGAEDVKAEKYGCEGYEDSLAHFFIMDMGWEVEECEDGE